MWRSSWWLESRRSSIPSSSSSPVRLLRPVHTVSLESTKGVLPKSHLFGTFYVHVDLSCITRAFKII
ncbi:hypothetical protein Taro_036793 [Colocasia esculenta]|uniref:Uncharacterized protein n=1 Tax=Colocasia esculenta TaxID=4460 RepID=A0A843VYK4_COLES|nr:hypothetical protein [Colocasia esculenta]